MRHIFGIPNFFTVALKIDKAGEREMRVRVRKKERKGGRGREEGRMGGRGEGETGLIIFFKNVKKIRNFKTFFLTGDVSEI